MLVTPFAQRSFSYMGARRKSGEENFQLDLLFQARQGRGTMTDTDSTNTAKNPVREAILTLAVARGVGKTLCPTEAARAVSEEKWRAVLSDVRAEAVRLMKSGEVSIYRKGRPVEDPDSFKGVYRIGLPGKPDPSAED